MRPLHQHWRKLTLKEIKESFDNELLLKLKIKKHLRSHNEDS